MHVQCLTIAPASTRSHSDHYQLVFCDKIPDAALLAGRFMARVGLDVELKCRNQRNDEGEEELENEAHGGGLSPAVGCCILGEVLLAITLHKLVTGCLVE